MALLSVGELVRSEFGDFRAEEFIAEGRTCEVYSANARWKSGPRRIAVKIFKPGPSCEGGMIRERELLRRIGSCSNFLVRLYCYVHHAGQHCLVEELLTPLPHVLAGYDVGRMTSWDARKLARDICSGLKELHSAGFIHADLKPSNIGWSNISAGFRLTDFGISFHLSEGSQIHAVQTWGFIAPETAAWNAQLAEANPTARRRVSWLHPDAHLLLPGDGRGVSSSVSGASGRKEVCPLSPKIDMWSLGCVVFQVCTGRKLILNPRGRTFESQAEIDEYLDFIDLSDLDPVFCDFVRRCLIWKPELRMSAEDALNHACLQETPLDRQFSSILCPPPPGSY